MRRPIRLISDYIPGDVTFLSIPVLNLQILELRGHISTQVHDGFVEQVNLHGPKSSDTGNLRKFVHR